MSDSNDRNVMLYFLAGVGVGALIGAAAGILLAPKSGAETREDLVRKFDELKGKVQDWAKTRKEGKQSIAAGASTDEAGA
jgi:gas vesicle protein